MSEKIIGRGAEALLIKKGNALLKQRLKKGYRHEHIDLMLRTGRTRREARILERAAKIIPVPKVLINEKSGTEINMEFIDGKVLSEWLDKFPEAKAMKICRQIGESVAKLHNAGIIHGDLTTSNMILREKDGLVYFIDFGLAFHSPRPEDKAVDLHLLKQALDSRHFRKAEGYFNAFLKGYDFFGDSKVVTERLKKVEARGRYKGKKRL